jgi:hypothetical protein
VTLKVLHGEVFVGVPGAREKVVADATLAASLEHPNIVPGLRGAGEMTRPSRTMLLITLVAALLAGGAGFSLGRASGKEQAPGLAVEPVERIDRPRVGSQIPVPTPISIPATLPR